MSEGRKDVDFSHELLDTPEVVLVQSLDGHGATVPELPCRETSKEE